MMQRERGNGFGLGCIVLLLAGCNAVVPAPGPDGESPSGTPVLADPLVGTDWLDSRLGAENLVIIDARRTADYVAGHIPGAVSASFSEADSMSRGYSVSYGGGLDFFLDADNPIPFQDGPPEQIQSAVRGLGIDMDDTVVVYDSGTDFYAARFVWTLTQHGFTTIHVLDGGLGKWTAEEREVTTDLPQVAEGDFQAQSPDRSPEATTDDVLAALSDPQAVLVSGLVPAWHYGPYVAYTEPGHIPGTKLVPLANFFDSDRSWKSPEETQELLDVLGITPESRVITYCGGGPLSACLYFTFKHVLGYPNVQNYAGSYIDWITDPRDLPVDLYDHPHLLRDTAWMRWWVGERIQTLVPVSPALAVDVRSAAEYDAGHIPWSVNISMEDTEAVLARSAAEWADVLGEQGVGDAIEVVAIDETVTPQATLLIWLLDYLGHDAAALAGEGLAGWEAAGHPVSEEATLITEPETPIDVALEPMSFTPSEQADVRLRSVDEESTYPFSRVWVLAAEEVPAEVPVRTYRHVPWSANLDESGALLSAGALWTVYEEADVPYFSEIICFSDDPAEATLTYFALKLLGFPRVAVYVPDTGGL
jgi:thiosulfate/3-mercaptopyruvate sulfurtransferase